MEKASDVAAEMPLIPGPLWGGGGRGGRGHRENRLDLWWWEDIFSEIKGFLACGNKIQEDFLLVERIWSCLERENSQNNETFTSQLWVILGKDRPTAPCRSTAAPWPLWGTAPTLILT